MQEASKTDESDTSENHMSGESESDMSWISWFCSRQGNEFFCEVDEEFITDEFNLTGLNTIIPHYRLAIDIILDYETIDNIAVSQKKIEKCAEVLYGLIHSRFILSQQGMTYMDVKYKAGDFGKCPRFHCEEQNCLPTSNCDNIGESHVLLYCPKCKETYNPRAAQHRLIDGAYFGTTFAHLFLLTHPQTEESNSTNTNAVKYVPRIFGFRLHNQGSPS